MRDEETVFYEILTIVGRAVQNHPARTSKGTDITRSADLCHRSSQTSCHGVTLEKMITTRSRWSGQKTKLFL